MLHGTSKSVEDSSYGGGFLLKDILEGKDIDVKVEAINGDIIESTTNIGEITRAQMIGTRMAFKNYTAFVNPSAEPVSSIFSAIASPQGLLCLTATTQGSSNS